MRLVSYEHRGQNAAGVLEDGHVVPFSGLEALGTTTSIDVLRRAQRMEAAAVPLEQVRLRPVVPQPDKIICVGLNYHSHVIETKRELPTYPVLFCKFASSLIGPDDPIVIPPESQQVDYEGELVVVIGEKVRRVSPAEALDAILGFSVANDVTMRDYQYKTHQWLQGKSWEGSTPVGPHLVTADAVDPSGLTIRTVLNGEVVQESDTGRLIFDVGTLVSVVSEFTTLLPGDLILTGTPGGVGYRRDPQVFLTAGDVVEVDISGIGAISSRVVAEREKGRR
jgi:acylpyruvate hydrolase